MIIWLNETLHLLYVDRRSHTKVVYGGGWQAFKVQNTRNRGSSPDFGLWVGLGNSSTLVRFEKDPVFY